MNIVHGKGVFCILQYEAYGDADYPSITVTQCIDHRWQCVVVLS